MNTDRIQQELKEMARKLEQTEREKAKLLEKNSIENEKLRTKKQIHDQALGMFKRDKNIMHTEIECLREKLLQKEVIIAGLRVEVEKFKEMSELKKLVEDKKERSPFKTNNKYHLKSEVQERSGDPRPITAFGGSSGLPTAPANKTRSRSSSLRNPFPHSQTIYPGQATKHNTGLEKSVPSNKNQRKPSGSSHKHLRPKQTSHLSFIRANHRSTDEGLLRSLEERVKGLRKELKQEQSVNRDVRDKIEGVVFSNGNTCAEDIHTEIDSKVEAQKRLFMKIVSKASKSPSVWEYFNNREGVKSDRPQDSSKYVSPVNLGKVTIKDPGNTSHVKSYLKSTAADSIQLSSTLEAHQKDCNPRETNAFSSGTTVREKERDTHVMIQQKQGGVSTAFTKIANKIMQIKEAI